MKDIIDTLKTDGSFQTLLSLLESAGLTERLHGAGAFTLFAPNDEAFTRVKVEVIAADKDKLASLLAYHVVKGAHNSAQIAENDHLLTESGKSLSVRTQGGRLVIDNAQYVRTDIPCDNGLIQVIDNVFLPEFSGWYCGGCC
ncbi:fasciclin domain-containing protein [Geomonas paludis]|uniref:Fasciclin domain-containing protein n=1 Tax=Geomonas paludis TaxID=2740185 RepID=A0A6V8MXS9_9BACT|nr:fasciclin domain-containing protein [Geomonas paludis]UPU34653.1 fasciclin domain-containing protein [Geomonas paludis]GFO65028.1 hypothetical protein GMPD_29470 [Geomonas paludis]